MYVYFNNQGILTTSIPHGKPVRQGSYLDLFICLEKDFPIEENRVNVELIFPDGGAAGKQSIGCFKAITEDEEVAKLLEFKKMNDSETTYDLKNGELYWTYHFRFFPEESTLYAGKLVANISIIKVSAYVNEEGVAEETNIDDIMYYGNIDIYVERTSGNAERKVNDNSTNYYQGIKAQVNELDNRKANKSSVEILDNKLNDFVNYVTLNRIGLLTVEEYNEETGYIDFIYDDTVVDSISYDEDTGILRMEW